MTATIQNPAAVASKINSQKMKSSWQNLNSGSWHSTASRLNQVKKIPASPESCCRLLVFFAAASSRARR
jgi:hypothetical protein